MRRLLLFFAVAFIVSCKKDSPINDPITYGKSFVLSIQKDKSRYAPGEVVKFTLNKPVEGNLKIRYKHLNEVISEATLNANNWTWTTPSTDYEGYMVDISTQDIHGNDSIVASIGVDVSSDWTKFPRYGFLSSYKNYSTVEMDALLNKLTRYHINGLQYYDWQYKHHWPMGGTAANPMSSWTEIANKEVHLKTLKHYIDGGHERNISSMFYNLAFGVLEDALSDGVQREWFAFKDNQRSHVDQHTLSKPFFKSNILLVDAANEDWQNYIAQKNDDVYKVLNFDGYHVDALGDRGALYDYDGNMIQQQASYRSFLEAMKAAHPNKKLVMNAVSQNGQLEHILKSPVEFAYTEVWNPYNSYESLSNIIKDNYAASNGKSTVLAAYMNYDKSHQPGYFNTHSVLLTDAVIFAFGGAHIELGEHMLGNEYFANNNLQMPDELSIAITKYYDFLVAYENLLRGGGEFTEVEILSNQSTYSTQKWPSSAGKIATVSKTVDNKQIFHLINFSTIQSTNWKDGNGTTPAPELLENVELSFQSNSTIQKIWMASPDINHGVAEAIPFTQNGNNYTFTIPSLKYWNMIVAE